MFNLDIFITVGVIFRSVSMYTNNIDANKEVLA